MSLLSFEEIIFIVDLIKLSFDSFGLIKIMIKVIKKLKDKTKSKKSRFNK